MNSVQFGMALVGSMGAFLGGTWIIAQAIQKTASNPLYDEKFRTGSERMDRLETDIRAFGSSMDAKVQELAKQTREVQHGLGNTRMALDGVPGRVIEMLRNTGAIKFVGGG